MKDELKVLGIIALAAVIGFSLATCDDTQAHTHTYSTTWSSNATQHWKECTGAGCDAKTETADHAPMDSICTTCEYDNTPPHDHTYSGTWSSNATQHWKKCTFAGCAAVTETANHTQEHGICTICEYGTITHTYSDTWSSDETQHWRECTFTGCDAKTVAVNHGYVYTVTSTSYPAQSTPICSSCGNTDTARDTIIGDTGPAGGIIFYVADGEDGRPDGITIQGYSGATGSFAEYTAYYLEAAPANETNSIWGGFGTLIANITTWENSATKNAGLAASIGVGRKDTQTIVNSTAFAALTDTAAQRCANKSLNGYTDWFLPSLGELNEMLNAFGYSDVRFWSSSQHSSSHAWMQDFRFLGLQNSRGKHDSILTVRAVRAF